MILSLAAALLGQAVPTLSKRDGPIMARDGLSRLTTEILEDRPPQLTLDHGGKRQSGWHYNRRLKLQVARNLMNTPRGPKAMMVPCDPRSIDPDVGILSCGQDSTCEPSVKSSLGGVCTPKQSSEQDQEFGRDSILSGKKGPSVNLHPSVPCSTGSRLVQCDPTSIDVGILVCGEDQFCMHDEVSALGGYCVDTTTSNNRRLVPNSSLPVLQDYIFICYYPADHPVACDCSDINNSTGTGTMYCTQNVTASYVQGCDEYVVYDTFSYSFNNSVIVEGRDCYETTTPFAESICFLYYVEGTDLVCYAEWNGQRCNSCALANYYVPTFDCSNVDGGRVGDSRKELLSVFDLCSNTTCSNFCGDGFFIPEYNFDINAPVETGFNGTCGILAYYEENKWFSDALCPYIKEAAQTYCCVPLSVNSTVPPGGGSSTPGPEPEVNSTTPGETAEEEISSTGPPGADSDQDNTSAGQSIGNFALVACETAVFMALVSRV